METPPIKNINFDIPGEAMETQEIIFYVIIFLIVFMITRIIIKIRRGY
ncbi:MAG: hypothetical protein A4E50_01994 [Methanosaeta sp. PtaB.Bin087]|nr:MAG: hypothetical protein A4E50_01994 [Methanosaeta sp. PtaB.Bin087]OPY53414.1 MAG: hypothetical protein A4E51_01127 [Methanosaeta sp. PtaU1.Bin055]